MNSFLYLVAISGSIVPCIQMGYIYRKRTLRSDVFDLGNQSARTSKCMNYAAISLKPQAIRTKKESFLKTKNTKGIQNVFHR